MKTLTLVLLAVLVLVPGTPTQGTCGGDRQACYRACVDCRAHCKGDETCRRTCYQIKRSCCLSNGHGGGPRRDCTCT